MHFKVGEQQIMQSVSNSLTFTVPLGLEARVLAEKFRRKHSNPHKGQQVYLNTLAVAAVKFYLHCIGWETDDKASLSYNPLMQGLMDVADLQVRNLGKLECRPVLPHKETVLVPPESANRIGYVAVLLDESFKKATILGFVKTLTNSGEIILSELESLADFLSYLHKIKQCEAVKSRVSLSQWFSNLFETGWIALEEIFDGIDEKKFAVRSLSSFSEASMARAKIIDLGLQLGNQSVVLLVAIAPYSEQKVEVTVQMHPMNEKAYLPSNVRLNLVSESGEILQEVQSRANDNFIQLKRFRGYYGEGFDIQISDGDFIVKETFVI